MKNRPDIERVLDRWFEEGPTAVPDHVFDRALEMIDETRQRRVSDLSWRGVRISTSTRIAAATVLILVVGVLVFGLSGLVRRPPIGTTSPSPEPTGPSASVSAQPTASTPRAAAWATTGSLRSKREGHTLTMLRDGRVLVVGGNLHIGLLASAELYDPRTGEWSSAGSLTTGREYQTATLLADGRVLVAGGYSQPDTLASAELYNPTKGTWTATSSMIEPRALGTATLLPNGDVLVVGGEVLGSGPHLLASAELYDPTSGAWHATGSMRTPRSGHSATLLPNGKVLVVGGRDFASGADRATVLSSAELFDPTTGTWTATGDLAVARTGHTATMLKDGEVLVAGGVRGVDPGGFLASAELYDPSTGRWSATGSMTSVRVNASATLLLDGRVLIAGGTDPDLIDVVASAELYDPSTGTWSPTVSLGTGRAGHTAVLLGDGHVLVVGGERGSPTDALASAELYDPGSGS